MRPSVAERLVEVLEAWGIEVVFGVPGVHNLALFDALDASERVRTVLVRHEATAAYAADAHGRLTGRPGVCITTSGPGAANTVAAMGEAQSSRSPMLHLTTTVATRHLGHEISRGVLHEHPDQQAIFAPVTKLARQVVAPAAVATAVDDALRLAAQPPCAPTYIEIPTDVLAEPGEPVDPGRRVVPGAGAPTRPVIRELAARLQEAERPLLWIGAGAAGLAETVLELAERLGAPVILTHSAKRGWSGGSHPLVVRHPPHEPAIAELCGAADAVLVAGSDLDGMMTQEFRLPLRNVLRIDIDPRRLDVPYPSAEAVLGDAAPVLRGLCSLLAVTDGAWGPSAVREADAAARAALEDDDEATAGMRYVGALDAALADREAIVVCDMAISGYWTGGYLPLAPGRRVIYPVGWGTLGFALPAAVGAAAATGRRVVVVCGDAGVLFAIGELATLAQEGLPVTVVVQSDSGYGMLRYDEERMFGRTFAVDLVTPDFPALARAFGMPGATVDVGADGLTAGFATAFDVDGPSLLEVTGSLTPPRITSPRWPLAARHAPSDGPA